MGLSLADSGHSTIFGRSVGRASLDRTSDLVNANACFASSMYSTPSRPRRRKYFTSQWMPFDLNFLCNGLVASETVPAGINVDGISPAVALGGIVSGTTRNEIGFCTRGKPEVRATPEVRTIMVRSGVR